MQYRDTQVRTRTARRAAGLLFALVPVLLALGACANPAGENPTTENPEEVAGEETPPAPVAPTIEPAGGTFEYPPELSLEDENTEGAIHYTLDGSEPGPESSRYEAPFTLPASREAVTVRARVIAPDGTAGALGEERYSVQRGPTLDIALDGAGTVAADPAAPAYLWDQEVELTAAADPDHRFDGWSGDASGSAETVTLRMDADKRVHAHFSAAGPSATTPALRGGILVNEILPDPAGSSSSVDTDGSGSAEDSDEFVELFNTGDAAVDLAGMSLWDAGSGEWFSFPADSVLSPGGYALVVMGLQNGGALPAVAPGSLVFDAGRGAGVLNNSSDNVVLLDPEDAAYLQVLYNGDSPDDPPADYSGFPAAATRSGEVEDWGDDRDGSSLARRPDGSGEVLVHSEGSEPPASPGTTNGE